jgi:hypothetical protein
LKVALVLTGLLRCFEQAYPSFKQVVLDRYDTDVYFDIWSEVGYYSGKGYLPEQNGFISTVPGERGFHTSGELVDTHKIFELYDPLVLRIEDFNKFEPLAEERAKYFAHAFTRPKNTISQAYKIYKGMQLVQESGINYDLVVRARPDIVLESDPGDFTPYEFLTLPSKNKLGQGTGDSLQIGSMKDMMDFAKLYTGLSMELMYGRVGYSCPHVFTQEWIKNQGLPWKELYCGAHIAHSPRGLYQEPE